VLQCTWLCHSMFQSLDSPFFSNSKSNMLVNLSIWKIILLIVKSSTLIISILDGCRWSEYMFKWEQFNFRYLHMTEVMNVKIETIFRKLTEYVADVSWRP
jgi:hypothetical protein